MAKKDYGSSNRRKFLIGAGSVAAGGSALFGTAATTTFNLNDRAVSANVVTDSSGAVALTDTEDPGDIINYTSDELEIDFTEGGASGVNVGSTVEIGNSIDPSSDAAFTITNQSTDDVDLTIEFKGAGFKSDGSSIKFEFENTTSEVERTLKADSVSVTTTDGSTRVSYKDADDVAPGEVINAAIFVNADDAGSNTGENLSGVLNITATQP